jgi:DNA-directed RNA polymerase I subunit RPA1
MNLHFPQDEVARAEAYLIACTANQYLVPKDGSPLRGLIQDHVVSGVLITKKDTFFTQEQFQQYLHIACQDICGPTKKIVFPDPVILKPKKLWTGKQIITGVLMNLTHGSPPLSLKGKTKIPGECWGTSTIEAVVRIRNNELLHGVLDKSQFGATQYGLIHAIYELYGGDAAGTMLTCLGRLFSSFIQIQRAFTCGLDDFLLANKAEDNRLNLLKNSYKVSLGASAEFAKDLLPKDIEIGSQNQKLISDALRQKLSREDSSASQTPSSVLDSKVKGAMNDVTSGVIKVALNASSDGLRKPFPFNNLALMTLSGAKGSNVNFSQISCLLGQQELEGKRVPRTTVGRTLPSFSSYDPSAKAGGFITNRFLTGIRPQEYYFHCMAGREGLVDTAVKTSRSGYLQRCLIKHLENVKVHYDQTVRDESRDSQIIQFNYGEDSVDVSNASYLYNQSKFDFLVENYAAVLKNLNPAGAIQVLDTESARKYRKKIRKQRELEGPLDDPVMSKLSSSDCLGSVSEAFESKVNEFVSKNASVLEKENLSQAKFEAMMWLKYLKSLIHPGEAVGVLTGQSVGEPSTQMTLNTFHLAGFGGANVTLGIPRLREIIMTAASKISTPLMQIYLQDSYGLKTKDSAEKLASALQKVTLNDICDGVDIKEKCNMETEKREIYIRVYYVEALLKKFGISLKKLQRVVKKVFIPLLQKHSSSEAKSKRKKKVVEDDIDDVDVEDRASKVQESTEGKEEDEGKASNEKDSDSEESESDKSESDDSDEDGEDSEVLETLPNEMSIPEELEGELVELSANLMGYDKLRFFTTYFEVQLVVDLNTEYLLSMNSVEQCCRNTVLTQISGISDCYITQPDDPLFAKSGEYAIQTDGANFDSIWMLEALHPELKIDLNRIYTNDISLILARYGVEAARNAIVKEIRSVFSVYGISVNPRHLFLLADFMASEGGFRALNRYGIKNASSPILKVTFETSSNFLTDALLFGEYDSLDTVSSRIFTGRPVNVGTGSFDLLQPLVL